MPTKRTQPLPNPQYGYDIYPWWNNLNDKVAYERMFATGRPTEMRVAQAMISQDPLTPNAEIRQNMTVGGVPTRTGRPSSKALTITQILNHDFELAATHVDDTLWNDFSDSNGETNSTARPNMGVW